jgi:hypothetical protein
MKKIILLLAAISIVVIFTSCSSDDDTTNPQVNTYSVSGTISDADGNGVANITVNLSGDVTETATTNSSGAYSFSDIKEGAVLTITPTADDYDFNPASEAVSNVTANVTGKNFTAVGIYGTWVSEGADVAPLLVSLFKIVKISATFNTNGSYTVTQEDSTGATLDLTGTFTVEKSNVVGINDITLDQTTPSVLTATGIYQITASATPFTMMYEVVQTTPDIGAIPPTAEAGFGSTNGGALGTWNIQKYVRQ